jgi:methionyl aminopeptidase
MEGENEYLLAGRIASQVRNAAYEKIAVGVPLLEIAKFCDAEIARLGAKPAFPVNLSINEIAAHYTPFEGDTTIFKENDIVKLDVGVQMDGYIADTAVTKILGEGNGKLKEAAEAALAAAEKALVPGVQVSEIGAAIEGEISSRGFKPIFNLTGHALKRYDLHAGLSIPNFRAMKGAVPDNCALAIEPFATTGNGYVSDGPLSEIFLITGRSVRLPQERIALSRLQTQFSTLPFASRWTADRPMLARLANGGALHNYPILREKPPALVAQAEHTFIIVDGKVTATTR